MKFLREDEEGKRVVVTKVLGVAHFTSFVFEGIILNV